MAIIRKESTQTGVSDGSEPEKRGGRSAGLGRGLDSLSYDNAGTEKKPLVVRRGPYISGSERPASDLKRPSSTRGRLPSPGVGGRVVVRSDRLPDRPIRSARSARMGTTVLIRTERDPQQKRYKVNEHVPPRDAADVRLDRPIVIKPRGKK